MRVPSSIEPKVPAPDGPAAAAKICRASRDLAHLAFWVDRDPARGLYVGETDWADDIGEAARRVWTGEGVQVCDLAWSGDGAWLALLISSGPPPGELRIGVVHVTNGQFTELPGMAFAWAGTAATLLVVDPAARRVYLRDMDLGVEHGVCTIADDGDPHFAPTIALSPDHRRFVVATRRVAGECPGTFVDLAHHDGRAWQVSPLTHLDGTGLRVLPVWSVNSAALALCVIDMEGGHTSIVAVPQGDGEGELLYTSPTIDGFVTPAPHPDGRLIAMIQRQPTDSDGGTEHRLVLIDPVERAVATIPGDAKDVAMLRWIDADTLWVEAAAKAWSVTLQITTEAVPEGAAVAEGAPPIDGFVPVRVDDGDVSFACEVPAGWGRVELPPTPADLDFTNLDVMRPVCAFMPGQTPMMFTVAVRPAIEGVSHADALRTLATAQGLQLGDPRPVALRCGDAVEAMATEGTGAELMRMRLVVVERNRRLISFAAMAPGALWSTVSGALNRVIESVEWAD